MNRIAAYLEPPPVGWALTLSPPEWPADLYRMVFEMGVG